MSQSSSTVLASGAITAADTITIELVEANEILLPSSLSDGRPSQPSFTRAAFRLALTTLLASSLPQWLGWRNSDVCADSDIGESTQKTGTDGLSTCSPRHRPPRPRSIPWSTPVKSGQKLQRRTRLPCPGRASAVGLVAWQAAPRSMRRSGPTSIWLCSFSVPI